MVSAHPIVVDSFEMQERESVLCIKSMRFTSSATAVSESDAMDTSTHEDVDHGGVDGSGGGEWFYIVGTSISSIPNQQDTANNIPADEDKEVCSLKVF